VDTKDPYLMNRLGNVNNKYQRFFQHKRVVCVCSAGLLRSPTAAVVLAGEPWNYNTRASGIIPEFALVPLDDVLLEWADEFVCMTRDHALAVECRLSNAGLKTEVVCLDIPDNFSYRDPELVRIITERYKAFQESQNFKPSTDL
jgi:predicted protein tyrosine phosphatase